MGSTAKPSLFNLLMGIIFLSIGSIRLIGHYIYGKPASTFKLVLGAILLLGGIVSVVDYLKKKKSA